jgi:FADH2 O2-dependent halogenase
MTGAYDIAIAGSGFSGSLLAMIARRLGRSVILLERGSHPRFAIGESSTPLANLMLEEIGLRYGLPEITPLAKWGAWQRSYPDVPCGLKRGFTFYHHVLGQAAATPDNRESQLLFAASPHDAIADTHWYRAGFDHLLLRHAQERGADYLDHVNLQSMSRSSGEWTLEGTRHEEAVTVRAKLVVDAAGPRGFLHHALGLDEATLPDYPETQALFTHFAGVKRLADSPCFQTAEAPPYPIDDAAVHHVFDGGWVWVLQFNNGVTSAGVAAKSAAAEELRFHEGAAAWERLLAQIPVLKAQFASARAERPFTHLPRLSFRSATMAGDNWAMLPSAAGFVDPLLSTGFPLTLLGVLRLAEIIEEDWGSESFNGRLSSYAAQTDGDLLAAAGLIGSLYANMGNFPMFKALSLLYFGAVSFSETARRLGKKHLAPSFLLRDDPSFGPVCRSLFARARTLSSEAETCDLTNDILRAIEPFDVAGLAKPHRRNWYPVDADDLFDAAGKLGATRDDISQLLSRAGFWPACTR